MNEEMKKVLESIIKSIEKNHGKGSATTLDQKPLFSEERVIRTGSMGLDLALGIGGYPRARIIEIYGPEACIAGDSYLQYEVWDGNKRINHKGGSIQRLYERFNKIETDEEPRQDGKFYVKSVNDEGMIIRNEVLDVVCTGEKQCYRVTTETGETLASTDEHKYMTSHGFSPLSDLSVGEDIYIHNNTRAKGKEHYLRGQQSRIAYEAYMNNMTYREYVDYLDTRDKPTIERLSFLPRDIHVHHIDEDFDNNDISNLQLVDPSEHGRIHARDRIKNLSFVIIPSKIVRIEKIEEPVKTYDLKCMYPYNNYIAEGIVVHNSGKTTLCLNAIRNEQENGGLCAFIDTEHALDVTYAKNLGVQTEMLLLSQPDFGEQALDILEAIVRSGDVSLVIVDSVASLVPQSELEGDMGSASIGTQARLMSKAMRKITPILDATNCTIIFTNQLRMKIGVMFGNPEITSGGNALKFYASQRLDIRRTGAIKIGDEIIGNETKVKVVKNKVASPFKEAAFRIMYGKGIDTIGEILDFSVAEGFIKRSGAWYSYGEERIGQGRQNAIDWLEENQQIAKELERIISEKKGLVSARQIQQSDTRRDIEETSSVG